MQTEPAYNDIIHAISHDFRAPIRHIREFFNLMMEEQNHPLTDDQQLFKGYIEDSIDELNEQIERLLIYSRVQNRPPQEREFTITELVNDCVQNLPENQQQSVVIVANNSNPTEQLWGFKESLSLCLSEVLSNAFKFQNEGNTPLITVAIEDNQETISIRVSDNGIGIEQRYLEDAFLPFRKLNNKRDFAGAGMGLTIAQAALAKLDGKIHLSSNAVAGIDAVIQLPKPLPKAPQAEKPRLVSNK